MVNMGYALRYDGSQAVDLAAVDTRGDGDIAKEAGKVEFDRLAAAGWLAARPEPMRC